MISVGETLVLFAAGAWALGPQELPRYARALGRLAGRASAQIAAARAQFQTFAERNEVASLHDEVNQTMAELRAIQSELRGGLNLSQPGPMTRRLLGISGGDAAGVEAVGGAAGAPTTAAFGDVAGAGPVCSSRVAGATDSRGSGVVGGAGLSSPAAAFPAPGALRPSFAASAELSPQDSSSEASDGGGLPPLEALPISAAAAGRVPDRTGTTPTGSEVMLDALMEEKIAQHAVAFLRGAGRGGAP